MTVAELFGTVATLVSCDRSPIGYANLQKLRSLAEGITIGFLRRVRIAEGGARIAICVFKNIGSAGSAASAATLVASARNTFRSRAIRRPSIRGQRGCFPGIGGVVRIKLAIGIDGGVEFDTEIGRGFVHEYRKSNSRKMEHERITDFGRRRGIWRRR